MKLVKEPNSGVLTEHVFISHGLCFLRQTRHMEVALSTNTLISWDKQVKTSNIN